MNDDSMDDERSSDAADRTTELAAAGPKTPTDAEKASTNQPALRTCPNCGRAVEAQFKFCDGCGTKLDAFPLPLSPEAKPEPKPKIPVEHKPLLARLRQRLDERKKAKDAPPPPAAPKVEPTLPPIPPPPAPAKPPAPKPPIGPPMKRRVAIAGRLRSKVAKRGSYRPATTTTTPPTWRPIQVTTAEKGAAPKSPPAIAGVFLLHLAIAFVFGLVLLAMIAGIAAVASQGRVQLLQERGLPVFITGAAAIVTFALFRTSGDAKSRGRAGGIGAVLVGFLLLIAASAVLLQPSLAEPEQRRLERVLGVFGSSDVAAVGDFKTDIRVFNAESKRFQSGLESLRKGKIDLVKFRTGAVDSEGLLTGTIATMRTHATNAKNVRLSEALADLAAVYEDRLAAFRVVATGFIGQDDKLVRAGDQRYQESKGRANEIFALRLRSMLEHADLNAGSFGRVVSNTR